MKLSTQVTRGAVFSVTRVSAGHVIGVIAFIIITREVTPSQYGVWALLLATSQIFYQLLIMSPTLALVRQRGDVEKNLLPSCFTLVLTRSWLLAAIAATGLFFVESPYSYLLLAITGYLLLLPFRFLPNVFFWRQIKLGRLSVSETLEVIALYSVAIFGILSGWGVVSFAIALVFASVVGVVSLIVLSGAWPRFSGLRPARQFSSKLRPFYYFSSLALGRDFGQVVLIAAFLGIGSAGIYAWANSITASVVGLFLPLISGLFIGLSKDRDIDRASEAIDISLRSITIAGVFILAPLAASLNPFVSVIFKSKWDEGIPVLLGLCFLAILLIIQAIILSLAYADGRAKCANRWLATYLALVAILGIPSALIFGLWIYPVVSIFIALIILFWSWRETFKIYRPGPHLARDIFLLIALGATIAFFGFLFAPATIPGLIASVLISILSLLFSCSVVLHQTPLFLAKQAIGIIKGG